MPTLGTTIDPRSPSYATQRQLMLTRLDELAEALPATGTRAHERIELLLDRDAPFLELYPTSPAHLVGGIGRVEDVTCVVVAHQPGASDSPAAREKAGRFAEIATENRLPLLQLAESDPLLVNLAGRVGNPTVTVRYGDGRLAELSDHTIAVRPAAVGDLVAEDERDAVRLARVCVRRLNRPVPAGPPGLGAPPKYDADDLLGTTDVREVLARILDASEFDEWRPRPGTGPVTGWGDLHGYPVAVVAGSATDPAKAVRFVELAGASGAPLLFLHGADTPDATLIGAAVTADVPRLAVDLTGTGGRAYRPRLLFAWPAEHPADAVIDPRDTRTALGIALTTIHSGQRDGT